MTNEEMWQKLLNLRLRWILRGLKIEPQEWALRHPFKDEDLLSWHDFLDPDGRCVAMSSWVKVGRQEYRFMMVVASPELVELGRFSPVPWTRLHLSRWAREPEQHMLDSFYHRFDMEWKPLWQPASLSV